MKRWNFIKPYDESTLPPVGKKVLVISDEGKPYIAEREPDMLDVYCGKHGEDGCAIWWTYLPPQIGKTYTNGDPEGDI